MLASPFAFYRGAPAVMAYDLAQTPSSGIVAQLCGDCHISNFGLFASPERSLVFDLNDFDETLPGPFEWDVKRTAASIVVAARNARLSRKDARVGGCAGDARLSHKNGRARRRELPGRLVQPHDGQHACWRWSTSMSARPPRANWHAFRPRIACVPSAKLTEVVDGERRIIHDPPLDLPPGKGRGRHPYLVDGSVHGVL